LSDRSKKPIIFRWTAPKGLVAMVSFLSLALFFEFLLVYSFQGFGLTDKTVWFGSFQIPTTNWTLTLAVSPLFHLLPIFVIVVLVCSWVYLTKYTAYGSTKGEAVKRSFTKKAQDKRRLKVWQRFFRKLVKKLHGIRARFQRIRIVSFISARLHFAEAAARSAFIVLMVFLAFSLLLHFVVYPDFIYNWVIGLYKSNPSFLNLVRGTTDWARGFGDALANVFIGVAPGFRSSLASGSAALTSSIVRLEGVSKYLLSQNMAALASAIVALIYRRYTSFRHQKRR
jgi:hypothetical protein